MKKKLFNKPSSSGLSVLKTTKMVIHEFWYDYEKPKYGGKAKLCYMDRDSFMVSMKTEVIYSDIARDVETRFDTSNYALDRLFSKGKK